MQDDIKEILLEMAATPYRAARYSDYYWVRGKLSGDPAFSALLEYPIFKDHMKILDLGCGRGLLAAWLLAAERAVQEQKIISTVFKSPADLFIYGIDLLERHIQCGNTVLQTRYAGRVLLAHADIRYAKFPLVDAIVMLDVMHFFTYDEQEGLLDRIRTSVPHGGVFVTRIGDASAGWRFHYSQWVDRFVASILHRRPVKTYCRPVDEWHHLLKKRGFDVEVLAMSQGTPFANFMLVCRVN